MSPAGRLDIVMHRRLSHVLLLTTAFAIVLAVGCVNRPPEPDIGALLLRDLAAKALAASEITGPALRQVSFRSGDGSYVFMVTDKDVETGIQLWADAPDQPPHEWRRVPLEYLRYQVGVIVNVDKVNIGAAAAMGAATTQWPGCVPRGQTLVGSAEGINWWYVFCDLPEGTVSGQVNARTGAFTPSGAPPAAGAPTESPGQARP